MPGIDWRETAQQAYDQAAEHNGAADRSVDLAVPEPVPWPELPRAEAYYGLAGEIVRLIEPQTEADSVAILVQILAMFGNAIGRTAYWTVEETRHHANLFVVLVGETAKGRKDSSRARAIKVFDRLTSSAALRTASGLSSGEGLIWAVRDEIRTRMPVKKGGRVVDYQDVITDPGISDKRLLVVESEFVLPLRSAAREGNTLSARLREAWDSGNLSTLTKNCPARACGAHVSLIGCITRAELSRGMAETELLNGLANRFLWVAVRRSKLLPFGGQPVSLGSRDHKLALAVEQATTQREIGLDTAAGELWSDQLYPRLTEGLPGLIGAITNRAETQVRRLAMIYALLDFAASVRIEHLLAAAAMWDYAASSARWIWGENTGNRLADDILLALKAAAGAGMSQNDIINHFSRHETAAALGKALATLQQAKLAHCQTQKTAGRPVKRWFAGPGEISEISEESNYAASSN